MDIDATALSQAIVLGLIWLMTGIALVLFAAIGAHPRSGPLVVVLMVVQLLVMGFAVVTEGWILIPAAVVFLLAGMWALRRLRERAGEPQA